MVKPSSVFWIHFSDREAEPVSVHPLDTDFRDTDVLLRVWAFDKDREFHTSFERTLSVESHPVPAKIEYRSRIHHHFCCVDA